MHDISLYPEAFNRQSWNLFLAKPVLVIRDTTEQPERIDVGTLRLVGTDEENIYNNLKLFLEDEEE